MYNFDPDDPQTSLYIVFQQFINPERNPESFDVEALITLAHSMYKESGMQIHRSLGKGEIYDGTEQVIEFREGSPFANSEPFVEYS